MHHNHSIKLLLYGGSAYSVLIRTMASLKRLSYFLVFSVVITTFFYLFYFFRISPSSLNMYQVGRVTPITDTYQRPSELVTAENSSISQPGATRGTTFMDTNPGCKRKILFYYRPQRAPTVYHHPPLVHYVRFGQSSTISLSYMDYMAMMSAYKFAKPERIIIHSDSDIQGKYWDLAQKWTGTSVVVNKVARVRTLGGKSVSWIQHEADYMKLHQLYLHGGITSDFDVLIVNKTKLKEQQSVTECVLASEGNIVNNGFNSCVKNSPLIKRILDSYHNDYKPHLWLYNCAIVPTSLLQDKSSDFCYNVYLDETICLKPNYGNARTFWLTRNGVDWQKKTAAHYYVKSGYPADERLLKADHSLAELLRYINDS